MNAFQKGSLMVGVVALVLVAVIGCQNPLQVGLGDKVDLDVPDVALTSHAAGEYLSGTVTLSGVYTDDFEISGITLSFDGGVTAKPAGFDSAERTWECEVITSDYPDGETEVLLTITDLSGKEIQKKILYYFDNTAPLVLMTTPQGYDTNKYNGLVYVRGEAADIFGIRSVELQIRDDATGTVVAAYELTDGTNAWVYEFDSRTYADPGGDLRLEVRATDRAGNVSDDPVSRLVHYDDILPLNGGSPISVDDLLRVLSGTDVPDASITKTEIESVLKPYIVAQIDNDLDKPSINIIAPANGQLIGGSAIVTGTAFDDDGVKEVWMRLDLNGDDVYDGAGSYIDLNSNLIQDDFEDEDWVLLSGTVVWSETLNAGGELYNTLTTPPGQVTIQVKAVDINNPEVEGNETEISITFDDSIPRIENVTPASGGFVSGEFILTADIRDDEGIDLVEVSYDGGVTYESLFDRDESIHVVASITEIAGDHLTLHHSIDTETNLPGRAEPRIVSEPIVFRIRISDNADPPFQALTYVTLNVDNETPDGTYTADPLEIDDASSGVQGEATDEGTVSGISEVHVYFIDGTTVYNPRDGSTAAEGSADFDDGSTTEAYGDAPDITSFPYPTDPADMIVIDNPAELGLVDTDSDDYLESITVSGLDYTWFANPSSGMIEIPDGPYDMHYVIFDSALNGTHYVQNSFIKNYGPNISSLDIGTDLDFSTVVDGDEINTYGASLTARKLLYVGINATDPVDASPRNPNPGIAAYEVRKLVGDTVVLAAASGTIDISNAADWPENTTVDLYAWVQDNDGIETEYPFSIFVDNVDDVDPEIELHEINSSSVVDGYVEGPLESTYDQAPDNDSDVSGIVAITGRATDDQRLETIDIVINGTRVQVASWDGGLFELDEDVAELTITYQDLDPVTGHTVDFSYEWDTSDDPLVPNSVGDDISIVVEADDDGGATATASDNTTVDVVPYISSVSTASGIKDANIRSMDGYYSIATSSAAATIRVDGYNLRPVANGVRISSDTDGTTGLNLGDMQGIALGAVSVDASYTFLTTDANSNRSGYLAIITGVDGALIPTINNVNADLTQNEEDDTFAKNLTLTDDRYIRFFNVYETGIVNGYYADMMMEDGPDGDSDPDLPTFGFVDDSAAFDLTLARESVTDESPFTTVRNSISRGLGWLQHGMGRDDGGSYFHVSTYNFSTGHQILFHDTYAKDYEFVASGVDGGFWAGTASPYWTGYDGDYVQNNNNDAIQMDWNQYAPGSLLNRYLVPKVFAKGNSLTGNAQVYLSFYDANEGALIFRNFQIGQTALPNRRGMNDAGQSNLTERTNVAAGDASRWAVTTSANNYFDMVVTDNNEAVFVYYNQSAGKIELVYTSSAPGNTTPASVTGADPQTTVNFSAVNTINQSFTGTHLSATIETDGDGGTPDPIHIAAYDGGNGDLVYIKLDSLTDTTPEIVIVDQHLQVGIWTDIEVDDTGVPYITYYNNSENGTLDSVKLAWYKNDPSLGIDAGVDGSGYVTGDWEAMTVPAIDTPNGGIVQFQRVNLDFEDLDNAGTGINLSPVVGYLADDLEYAKILPELP